MAFSSIIGQTEAKARLGAALSSTPGHAYVLSGPDGIGKTMMAREFAKALLCMAPTHDGACDACTACRHFSHGVHPDFINIQLEGKDKNIKVEKVRQAVSGDLHIRPQFGSRKVYLLAADALNEQGQNALLKSLEEPPDYCCFIMTAIGPERLLPTIISRVSLIALRRYTIDEIKAILTANGQTNDQKTAFFARFAGGLAGVAIDLAGNAWFAELRQEVLELYRHLGGQTRTALLVSGYQFFDSNRAQAAVILDLLGSLIRDQLVLVSTGKTDLLTNQDQLPLLTSTLPAQGGQDAQKRLARAYTAILAALRGLAFNASFEGLACNLLLEMRKELQYV